MHTAQGVTADTTYAVLGENTSRAMLYVATTRGRDSNSAYLCERVKLSGSRTCGVDHRPPKQLLDRLEEVCSITPPREHGLDTVDTIKAMLAGQVKVFVSMGGNFSLATPETEATFAALRNCELTVQVSTKLNRSYLVHGRKALILPCLGRTEQDVQQAGEQGVTVGLRNLRTALFMNADDMRERGLDEFDLIDITRFAQDGSTRSVYGYMPELNVLALSPIKARRATSR